MNVKTIIDEILKHDKNANIELIKKAFKFAKEAHKGQKRMSGEDYFIHPSSAALILAGYGFDDNTIAACLLHDVVEDTDVDTNTIKNEFNEDIANLVEGVTKINLLTKVEKRVRNAEAVRKMLLAMTKDIRVVFIKLADKLHNMRTLQHMPPEKQRMTAKDALEIYAPLAYRLGLAGIRGELEDLSMKFLYPEEFNELRTKIPRRLADRRQVIDSNIRIIKRELKRHSIVAEVKGRPKHLFSILSKMKKFEKTFDEIYDVMAYRIVVKDVETCYGVLGIIHYLWKPMPERFKDYIASPKANMYQSLHTTVIGDDGYPIEIQIRTKDMNKIAEEGIAAHWRYKDMKGSVKFDRKLSWMRQILDWKKESKEAGEFIDNLKLDFFKEEIFCFTPKNDIIELPEDATVIDFAFAVHSEVGMHCSGAKVNKAFVPLNHELTNGDVVEIITKKNQKPSRTWLGIAKTARALTKIKKSIKDSANIPAKQIIKKRALKERQRESIVVVKGLPNAEYRLPRCCNPLPGDNIKGYVIKSGVVSIHKSTCNKVPKLESGPVIKKMVTWRDDFNGDLKLAVLCNDRVGLLLDMVNTIAHTGTNIKGANVKFLGKQLAECSFEVELVNLEHLKDLIRRIMKINSVIRVFIGEDQS